MSTDYVKQIQSLQAYIAQIDGDLARVAGRLESFYPERAELEADLERLASVRSELVAMAAHSDEAYAKLRPHDRSVAELVQRKDDLDAMIVRLEAEQQSANAAREERCNSLRRLEELHLDALAMADLRAMAAEFEQRLRRIAYGIRFGGSHRSMSFVRDRFLDALTPVDPVGLPSAEREAIRRELTGGLLGTPVAQ